MDHTRHPSIVKNDVTLRQVSSTSKIPEYALITEYPCQYSQSITRQKPAEWKIKWHHHPLKLFIFTMLGTALAMAHHLTFAYFDGKTASDSALLSQTAIKQVGNVFVFLVLAAYKAVINDCYNQYIWMLVQRRFFKLKSLNKAFSLPNRVWSFFSMDLLKHAKLGIILAGFSRLLFIGGVTPAATLSVVTTLKPDTVRDLNLVPTLDYNKSIWSVVLQDHTNFNKQSSPQAMTIATQAAYSQSVIPPPAFGPNTSYTTNFYGPTVQCSSPTEAQQDLFDQYSDQVAMSNEDMAGVVTAQVADKTNKTVLDVLLLSAFSPTIAVANSDRYLGSVAVEPTGSFDTTISSDVASQANGAQRVWIQLANSSIICVLVNASFTIHFNFTNGVGVVASQSISTLPVHHTFANGINIHSYVGGADENITAYFSTFLAVGSMIFGNLSFEMTGDCLYYASHGLSNNCSPTPAINVESSRILQTGLAACDEIVDNYWSVTNGMKYNFTTEPWMCRNRSLSRAIEDLANNITISMLSDVRFTKSVPGDVFFLTSVDVYEYDMRNLVISYTLVLLVTLISICVGLYSLLQNGVYHDVSFASFMATTRNMDLDAMSVGTCLGDVKSVEERKLMFGLMVGERGMGERNGVPVNGAADNGYQHAAFGIEGSVMRLRKGMPCS